MTQPDLKLDKQIQAYFEAQGIPMPELCETSLVWCKNPSKKEFVTTKDGTYFLDVLCPAVSAPDNEGYQLRCLRALKMKWVLKDDSGIAVWYPGVYSPHDNPAGTWPSPLAALADITKNKEK